MKRLFTKFARLGVVRLCVVGALLLSGRGMARAATTLPSNSSLQFQTSSRDRPPTIGDWYTTSTSSSTDRVHRILIEVTPALLNANGGTVNVIVTDADCNGNLDEVFDASDPARFELRNSADTVLQSQTVASGAMDNTILTFPISTAGTYQLVVVNGAFPVSGDSTTTLNNDDNTYSVTVPGSAATLIGQFQGTFSPTAAVTSLPFYFLVGPGQGNLRLRNFDMDLAGGTPTVSYTRPGFGATPSSTFAGTTSGNGVWNNGGSLNAGEDTVSISNANPYPDAGQWGITVGSIGAGNQFALEANSGTQRLVLFDQPVGTADAGNFVITPDDTKPGVVGTPVDHPFTITNNFFTNDIINLAITGTSANYTVQLLDSAGNPLTDGDSDGKVDTGILTPFQSKNFILRVTPNVGAGASDTTKINATSLMDARVVPGTVTTLFVNKITTLTNVTNVSGTIYGDTNHNGSLDSNETGFPTTNFFVKLVPAAGGNAVAAAAVNPSTGTYIISSVTAGSYNLVLDNNGTLTDTTPTLPPASIGTESANGIRAVVVPAAGSVNQNFGRFSGAVLTGRVFRDDGTGGGIANNGILDGGELGIGGVAVSLQSSSGATIYDNEVTDASGNYSLYTPATGGSLRVVEVNPSSYLSTGAQVGTTAGTYSSATDAVTFTATGGTSYSGVNFGDVPPSIFTEDNVRVAAPGESVVMPHVFTAGTAGSLSFVLSATSAPPTGWSNLIYLDANNDGILQPSETQITSPIPVVAGQKVSILTKVFTPLGASTNSQEALQVKASLTYANQPGLVESISHNDLVTISSSSGLILTKVVDKSTATKGDDITYTITFRNSGTSSIGNIVVSDTTPTFTLFRSAATGTLPTGLTAPTTSFPPINTAGPLKWTFGGTLAAGASGSVTFVVRLQ